MEKKDTPQSIVLSISTLPDEILQSIFHHLDAKTLVTLSATCRRFTSLANEPLLWRRFCAVEFRYWKSRSVFRHQLRDATFHEWKKVYSDRLSVHKSTRMILDGIIQERQGRTDRIQEIVDNGYNVKDALLQAFKESPSSPYHLAQRYWSHVCLASLHRSIALEEWTKIKYRTDTVNPIERSLAPFDLFVLDQHEQGDTDDLFDRLDEYVKAVGSAYPDLCEQTPRTRAITIASYLRDRRWVGLDAEQEYHSLDNMFLGVALFSQHRNSIPLISAVIYSYVARQFDLRAYPVSYPNRVHVLVQPPSGIDLDGNPTRASIDSSTPITPKTHLYMDPFGSIEPVSIERLQAEVRFLDPSVSFEEIKSYMSPVTNRDLLIRSARNILSTRRIDPGPLRHPISSESAIYAALFALVLFPTHPANLRAHLTELMQHFLHHFDHDIHIFRTYILPLTNNLPDHLAYRNISLQLMRNDLEPPLPRLRSHNPTGNKVRYRVGQLFRHRLRSYLGLITGWDHVCEMSPQWISMNQVDRLPRGRDQPFYNVLVIDDRSPRYVAEENVVLLGPKGEGGSGETVTMAEVETWPIEIGRYMKRFVVNEEGEGWRFESNLKEQFPED